MSRYRPVVRHRSVVLIIGILAVLALPLHARLQPPPPGERWTRTQIDELTVYSNARDSVVIDVTSRLLLLRDALASVSKLNVRSPWPTIVFVFRSEEGFGSYRDVILARKTKNVRGIFNSAPHENFILVDASAGELIDHVVYHELTHYFVRNTVTGLPLWFDEGIAEFYSSVAPASGDSVRVGVALRENLEFLRSAGVMPLLPFLSGDARTIDLNNEDQAGRFYAQSWLMVHYLLLGNPERGRHLAELLAAFDAGKSPEEALRSAFGTTLEEFEGELRRYLQGSKFPYMLYKLANARARAIPRPVPAGHDEVLESFAQFFIQHGNPDEAKAFLAAALEANPLRPETHVDLAMIASDPGTATAEFERALALAGDRAGPYARYGMNLVAELQKRGHEGIDIPQGEIVKARALAQKALELQPDSPMALGVLGATYTFRGEDAKKGVEASERSLHLAPDQPDVAADLVHLYARTGRFAPANRLLSNDLARARDQRFFREASESLLLVQYEHALDAEAAGTIPKALALFESVVEKTSNEKLKEAASRHVVALRRE